MRSHRLNGSGWRPLAGAVAALLLGACAALPQPEIVPPGTATPAVPLPVPPASVPYRVEQAKLTLHTYRAGWLPWLAHNHVLETSVVGGEIHLAEPLRASLGRIHFRPWDLRLDDPAARQAAGEGFESRRTAAEIAATRTRMLGPAGLDSNAHPLIVVEVRWLDPKTTGLSIHLRGDTFETTAPVTWHRDGGTLRAAGDFELSQRALGMRPYSAFAGAIAVADRVRVMLELTAVRSGRL